MGLSTKDRLIVALDYDTMAEVERLLDRLQGQVSFYKVGLQLFSRNGPRVIQYLVDQGAKVFADLKLHDIPNTVAKATRALTALGVNIIDVHVSGGTEMMRAAAKAATEAAEEYGVVKPAVIGVTVLTSLDRNSLAELGWPGEDITQLAVRWARMAQEAGLDGVVASPLEAKAIREACGEDFIIVTPGIRPRAVGTHDQKRVTTPREAIALGASHLVVGRAITEAENPQAMVASILQEMEGVSC
ncbi:MAG TPA: orotidine-5'-phosphate decarboxylase [Clostridia bacterium]|nr:orotidine-5'-phosphate decarboxylase [Clostridia bacterium]